MKRKSKPFEIKITRHSTNSNDYIYTVDMFVYGKKLIPYFDQNRKNCKLIKLAILESISDRTLSQIHADYLEEQGFKDAASCLRNFDN